MSHHLGGIHQDKSVIFVGQFGDLVDGIDDAGDVAHPGHGDIVDAPLLLLQQRFQRHQIDRPHPLFIGQVHHTAQVFAMGQVVGVVLHNGDQRRVPVGPQLLEQPGQAVHAGRRAATGKVGGIDIRVGAHKREHTLVGPPVIARCQSRGIMQQGVGVGIVLQHGPNGLLGGAHHQRGGGGVEVDAARFTAGSQGIGGIEADEIGHDPLQKFGPLD